MKTTTIILNALKEAHTNLDLISDITSNKGGLIDEEIENINDLAIENLGEHEEIIMEAERSQNNTLESCEVTIKVNLTELKIQKQELLRIFEFIDGFKDTQNGLLSLIDAIQDQAIAENGFDENDIFAFDKEN